MTATGIASRVDQTLARLRGAAEDEVHRLCREVEQNNAWEECAARKAEEAWVKWDRRPNWPGRRKAYEDAAWEHGRAINALQASLYQLRRAERRREDLCSDYERDRRIDRATRNQELRRAAVEGELLS